MPYADARCFAIETARLTHDHRSEDVVALDLRGRCSFTDFLVICTGTSDRQIRSVADRIIEYGKKLGERPFGVSGYENALWVVLDYVDVVVHVFAASHRAYYDLELLWGDAPRLEWARSETA
jgi:ribosome-associated protein